MDTETPAKGDDKHPGSSFISAGNSEELARVVLARLLDDLIMGCDSGADMARTTGIRSEYRFQRLAVHYGLCHCELRGSDSRRRGGGHFLRGRGAADLFFVRS